MSVGRKALPALVLAGALAPVGCVDVQPPFQDCRSGAKCPAGMTCAPAGICVPADGGTDTPVAPPDGRAPDGPDSDALAPALKLPLGELCRSADDCAVGHCTEGVCCESDCTGACMSCLLKNNARGDGECRPVVEGRDPDADCPDDGAPSCKRDGECDGAGGCRLHAAGVVCQAASCSGSMRTLAARCDGDGSCLPALSQTCSPYQCGSDGDCLGTCGGDGDCVSGKTCAGGSCGRKPLGAACAVATECDANRCEQGICCSSSCTGACRSCAVPGSMGACTAVPAGVDIGGQCADQGAPSCGTDGQCDGKGACRRYGAGTLCAGSSCSGGAETPARTCDGAGTCRAEAPRSCAPYVCGASSCLGSCAVDTDCSSGHHCSLGICAPLVDRGGGCTADTDCASSFCVDGRCCESRCEGPCQACSASKTGGGDGICQAIGDGADPDGECPDDGVATCGRDGTCDGAGGCRLYASGAVCAAQSCTAATRTLSGRCNGTGACVPGVSQSCAPYVCGPTDCKTTCTSNADCLSPQTCVAGSCGKKPNGLGCAAASECQSGFCEQGTCCATTCNATCRSCALVGSAGSCTPVGAGEDPLGQCNDAGAAGCGQDGKCDGGGACRLYAAGTVCAGESCSGGTFTSPRTCNGAGSCGGGGTSSCSPYVCAGTSCGTSCGSNADCASGFYCAGGSCLAKKDNGAGCSSSQECTSGQCHDGVCCESACGDLCEGCSASRTGAADGLCRPVSAGTDPDGECPADAASTCGRDGKCDGGSACRLHASGTVCVAPTCSGSVRTLASTCDGAGTCGAGSMQSCAPYQCGTGGSCLASCGSNADCVSPNICQGGLCGQKPTGAPCGDDAECGSGFCRQGVCCTTDCSGPCRSCDLAGSAGSCTPVPNGQDPLSGCADQGPSSCGTDGDCDGSGACRFYGSGTLCAGATCSGTTFTAARTCNGSGTCNSGATSSCSPYVCGSGACRTSCSSSADCATGSFCSGTSCVAKKANGVSCSGAGECLSGFCNDGVCCGSDCTGTCKRCNATPGTCTTVTNADDPDTCPSSNSTCSAAGLCKLKNGRSCSAGSGCASSFCRDGVCCNTACDTTCVLCNRSGSVGTCTEVEPGLEDPDTCFSPQFCGTAQTCRDPPVCGDGFCDEFEGGCNCFQDCLGCFGSGQFPSCGCESCCNGCDPTFSFCQ